MATRSSEGCAFLLLILTLGLTGLRHSPRLEISCAQRKVAAQGGVLAQNLGVAARSVDVKA
jgi:hypothetical protein